MILNHWQQHCPTQVRQLRDQGLLEQALTETEEATADLLYELMSVYKLEFLDAWEMATREWALLPTEAPLADWLPISYPSQ
jgi:hypothetical protein